MPPLLTQLANHPIAPAVARRLAPTEMEKATSAFAAGSANGNGWHIGLLDEDAESSRQAAQGDRRPGTLSGPLSAR